MKWNFAFHELSPFIQILKVQIFYKTRALHFYSSKPETFLLRSSALLLLYFIWRYQSFKNNISCFFFFSFLFFKKSSTWFTSNVSTFTWNIEESCHQKTQVRFNLYIRKLSCCRYAQRKKIIQCLNISIKVAFNKLLI